MGEAENANVEEDTEESKRQRRLNKVIEGNVLTLTVRENGDVFTIDASELTDDMKHRGLMFGLSEKIGNAAAGKTDATDISNAIKKVIEGIINNNWAVRAPAGPKITLTTIKSTLAESTPEEAQELKDMLSKFGVDVAKFGL